MLELEMESKVKLFTTLEKKISQDIEICLNDDRIDSINDDELVLNWSKITKYSQDIDFMRRSIHSNERYQKLDQNLHLLDIRIQNLLIEIEDRINRLYKIKCVEEERRKAIEKQNIIEEGNTEDFELAHRATGDYQTDETIESLRSRLLSTKYDQLDQVQTTEIQNDYHDSLQQELISSLPSMVSALKDQALQFQELIKQDASILKEASQNFEASHGKFDNVNSLLSTYHKEGRLGFWFYIRIFGMVMVSFIFLLIIIRLIPARH